MFSAQATVKDMIEIVIGILAVIGGVFVLLVVAALAIMLWQWFRS